MENTTVQPLTASQRTHHIVRDFGILLFALLAGWYVYIHFLDFNQTEHIRQIWGSSYQILAIFGAIVGFGVSHRWGGYKSVIGRAAFYFSLGLLLQTFGQSVSSYYNFIQGESIPYPSLGDVGFMGSVFAYIAGAYFLLKATGFTISSRSVRGKVLAILLPIVILAGSYFLFLQGYQFDWTNKLKIFLDFGYPLGQAVYVSMALLAFLMSQKYLGGIMKKPLLLLIAALVFQYISDFTFLYQSNAGTWTVGGINDCMYCISYFLMALSLLSLGATFNKIKSL